MIGIDKIKKMFDRGRDPVLIGKRLNAYYKEHGHPEPGTLQRTLIEKIREDYDKELAKLERRINNDLDPLLQEEQNLHKRLKEMAQESKELGKRRDREHKELAYECMKAEIDVLTGEKTK